MGSHALGAREATRAAEALALLVLPALDTHTVSEKGIYILPLDFNSLVFSLKSKLRFPIIAMIPFRALSRHYCIVLLPNRGNGNN